MDELSIVALTVSLVALAATGFTLGMSSAALRRADDNEDSLDLTDDYVFGEDTDDEGNRCGGLIDRVADLETVQQEAREKAEAIALTASEIKARLVMEVTAKQAIEGLRKELADLQAQVAGMQVSREVLTEPEFKRPPGMPRMAFEKPAEWAALAEAEQRMFEGSAYVDGGHAATDEQPYPEQAAMEEMAEINQKAGLYDEPARDPRWNHGDLDPETAEAQPQPDDDQATAVNDVQAVEEWDEAKRGEVA